MKLDLSTVFLVVLCVIPGLFALRARNLVCPRSFEEQGATSELGELVALGVSTHGVLVCALFTACLLAGLLFHGSPLWYVATADRTTFSSWAASHRFESVFTGTAYIFVSFAVSHWLGIVYGSRRLQNPITAKVLLFRNSFVSRRLRITGLLGERPIIYEALSPPSRTDGNDSLVFVEVELKGGLGFYTGQVSRFAILKDDEPHKPIYLIDSSFKLTRSDDYEVVEADGVLLDLADAAVVRVTLTDRYGQDDVESVKAVVA